MAVRYCVPCLKEESRVQATHISDGAGYCFPCAREMKAQGQAVYTVSEWARKELQESRSRRLGVRRYVKVTPEMRREIIAHPEVSATKMAAKFGISVQTVHNVWAASNEAMEYAVKDLDVPRSEEKVLSVAVAEHGPEAVEEAVEVVPALYRQVSQDSGIFAGIERHPAPAAPEPEPAVEVVPADVPVEALKRREADAAEIAAEYRKWQDENKVYATPPEPATARITLDLTHETANAIWGGLTLEEKATFCRTKIIERLELLA